MKRLPVSSQVLRAVGYDPAAAVLEVEFTSGGVYRYDGVPPAVFDELLSAESHGQYFNAHVRDRYPYERLR